MQPITPIIALVGVAFWIGLFWLWYILNRTRYMHLRAGGGVEDLCRELARIASALEKLVPPAQAVAAISGSSATVARRDSILGL